MDSLIDDVQRLRGARIQWKKEDKTFSDLHTQIGNGKFNLDPEHQRHVVHNALWKSEILHSQIYHGDIPDVYFHPTSLPDGTRRYDSLDGKQRCSAIIDYFNDGYKYKNREPKCMHNKFYSQLEPVMKSFLSDDCTLTIRIANRPLNENEIQSFFQKRQECKKTTGGEHLNSCITSSIHRSVKEYIETPSIIELMEKAGFKKNDRYQYFDAVCYILRIFTYHKSNNIDCSPTLLKKWFNSENPLNNNSDNAFKLVNITLEVLCHIWINGGNSRKNAYVSCAWYIMNNCYHDNNFDMGKIEDMKKEIHIDLPVVGGVHNGELQRIAFKEAIKPTE